MSTRVVPVPNCCPPIAWRPPQMLSACPAPAAARDQLLQLADRARTG